MQGNLGTVADLIEYFNMNKHIFQKQKNSKQHMQRIMAMLTQQNMKILQKQFQLYTKGLQLPTFIYLMKKLYVPQNQLSKYYFVSDLIKFFQAIDVNGDGHLQWSQFTQYIIENIRRVQKPNYKNKIFEQNQVISSAYSKISNQYKITKIVETGASNNIKKIIYISKQQKYLVLETGSNSIKIFNHSFQPIDSIKMKSQCQSTYIIDFSYDQQNQIFCALFEGSARFCNVKVAGAIKFMNQVEQKKLKNYHKVQYLHIHKYWAFASKTGQIKYSKVSYKSRTQMTYTPQYSIKLHDGLITDIIQIEEPKYILTSSMDGTIKLFSMILKNSQMFQHISQQTHSIINGKNKKGILGIDYTRQFGSYILSYGFSTNIYIYSLDISLTKGYIGKYSQHSGNLIAVKFLKNFPYVLSFDDKLNLRIWDFRTFNTIQIINCQKNFINPSYLQIIPELSQCLICQKKITQFRAPSLEKKSKQINEFYNIFDFKICSISNNIFIFTSNDVRVYNYITGSLINVFTKLDQNSFKTNITAAQFGYKSRKFFLGDAAGYIRQYDSETGEYLQEIRPSDDVDQYENKSIVKIMFLKQHSLLIVCSEDGRIMIYERNSNSEFQIIRDIRQSHIQLTCASCSVRYCLLATGSDSGIVNIWNLEKFSLESVLVLEHRIVNIAFSPIHPIMFIMDVTGTLSVFYVRPFDNPSLRYKCFLKITLPNQGVKDEVSSFSFDLIINAYFSKNCSLIKQIQGKHHLVVTIGLKKGQIIVANLNPILAKFKIQENHQIFSTKKSIRCQVQSVRTLIQNQKNRALLINNGYSNSNPNIETVSLNQFKRKNKFVGHSSQCVDQLLLVKQNSIILSTSFTDKKLKVWSLQGELNGCIDFFTFKKLHWKVSLINFHKKIQAIETCIYAIKLIENRKFTQAEEQEIKINLLMNQFMDDIQRIDYFNWIKVINRNRCMKIRSRPIKSKKQIQMIKKSSNNSNSSQERSSQNEQLLQQYFRNLRHQQQQNLQNIQNLRNSKTLTQSESISKTQFDQIYNKLVSKIKHNLKQSSDNVQFSNIDLNKFTSEENERQMNNTASFSNGFKKHKKNRSGTMVVNVKKDRITGQKEDTQYDRLFNKCLNKPKLQKKRPKKANLLYQNLTEARRKIDLMNTMMHRSHSKLLKRKLI